MKDTFYKLGNHDPIEVMKQCHEKSFQIFIDIKDDNYRRTPYDISFDECLEIFKQNRMHWVFIHRNSGFPTFAGAEKLYDCFEIGGCTIGVTDDKGINRDVFLFMYLYPEDGHKILQELNLNVL
ncbi:MAG: hypothetical protein WC979_02110 [Candidatus Pacearchaeota archaeon]|jgi:hypothetical protein|nr:hypothetical protein [Clostridia bacterium]